LLVDSTGIKFLGEGEWKRKKHGSEYRRQWRKVHLGIDASTLETRAIEVTDNSMGDAPMLPELLGQIPQDEPIASVSADGAYDTKACHAVIVARGAQAVIPPRRNAHAWKASLKGALARNEAIKACHRLGRPLFRVQGQLDSSTFTMTTRPLLTAAGFAHRSAHYLANQPRKASA
jgi:hypothetical protein